MENAKASRPSRMWTGSSSIGQERHPDGDAAKPSAMAVPDRPGVAPRGSAG